MVRLRLLGSVTSRPKAHLAVAFVAIANHLSVVGLAAAPAVAVVAVHSSANTAACSVASDVPGQCKAFAEGTLQLGLPGGAQQCPESGAGASCEVANSPTAKAAAGVASTPDGMTPCPAPPDTLLSSPAACSEDILSAPAGSPGAATAAKGPLPRVEPSVPISSLAAAAAVPQLYLASSTLFARSAQTIRLTATANASVTGTSNTIEIFDETTQALAASCSQGGRCSVAFAAPQGTHRFIAFLTTATSSLPAVSKAGSSNEVSVTWIGLKLDASSGAVVGPGKALTVTATSTANVDQSGYVLQIFDQTTNSRLAYCGRGAACSISLTQAVSGIRNLVATVAKSSPTYSVADAIAVSETLPITWIALSVSGFTTGQVGGSVVLYATANADVSTSPWSIGIFDEQGRLVAAPCKTGTSCGARVTLTSPALPHYTAAIGAIPPAAANKFGQLLQRISGPTELVDIQARSEVVQPTRMLWGVDSCKSFANDEVGNGLYLGTAGSVGWPDFWGRYLTSTICPGISAAEVAAAHRNHVGILPIFNDFVCSNVVGYDTGKAYAASATGAAAGLHIPAGRVLAVDIEPPGDACPGAANVDPGFVQGWYDGVTSAHYVPAYYGNGTPGSEFASAWCGAVAARPEIAAISFLWSFEPSLMGNFSKAGAPGFGPYSTGCGGNLAAWQYQIGSAGSTPDIDQDLALSMLPLWYP